MLDGILSRKQRWRSQLSRPARIQLGNGFRCTPRVIPDFGLTLLFKGGIKDLTYLLLLLSPTPKEDMMTSLRLALPAPSANLPETFLHLLRLLFRGPSTLSNALNQVGETASLPQTLFPLGR